MMDEILTIRTPKTGDRPYFTMARETAQDKRLSWEARGVLAYLLSKPDDWQVIVKDLQQQCGRDKVKKILKELIDCRYLKIHSMQHDEKGKFAQNTYQVYETPFTENPSTDSPSTANPLLTYNRVLQITEKQGSHAPSGATPPKLKPVKKPPYNTNRWTPEQVATYWTEHATALEMLVVASGIDNSLCADMSQAERKRYITTHRDLAAARFEPENYKSLYAFAKSKSWKTPKPGGMPITEMTVFIMEWRNARLANPDVDPAAEKPKRPVITNGPEDLAILEAMKHRWDTPPQAAL